MEAVRKAVITFTIRPPQVVDLSHDFTLESLEELIKFLEHRLYPRTLKSESVGMGLRYQYFKNLPMDSNVQLSLRPMFVSLKKGFYTLLQASLNPLKLSSKFCAFFLENV